MKFNKWRKSINLNSHIKVLTGYYIFSIYDILPRIVIIKKI